MHISLSFTIIVNTGITLIHVITKDSKFTPWNSKKPRRWKKKSPRPVRGWYIIVDDIKIVDIENRIPIVEEDIDPRIPIVEEGTDPKKLQ